MNKVEWVAGLALGVSLTLAHSLQAGGGRMVSGDHPYHNGYLFIPPSSAYEAVRVRPPVWFGAPSYYYPQSYLATGYGIYPPATYPGVPIWRAGGYFMADYGPLYVYPRIR